jgi:uncharacterized protein (TIGR02147 family)
VLSVSFFVWKDTRLERPKDVNSTKEPRTDSATPPLAPVLSAYTDYRQYLKEFYEYKRLLTRRDLRPYSYATFAASADIKSPNYLKLIMDNQRNLSSEMAKKFARALGLAKDETEEFQALVDYNQALDPLERNRFLKSLQEVRVRHQLKAGTIQSVTWEKIPSWVIWVVYAMAEQKGVNFERMDKLLNQMRRNAKLDDLKRALEKLLTSGELIRGENGEISKGRELMSGTEAIPKEMIRKIQTEFIYLGLESLVQDAPQDREFGAMTASLTEGEYEQLKFELRQFRKRWAKDVSVKRKEMKGDRVFQLNIQLFPVTKKSED